mmetsp:Transcript_139531/g.253801  ORF Transcript_139531/g.253801 Transcript_139531/m.253801 type:complete len:227 (-) Transcript_139531:80-760(-)
MASLAETAVSKRIVKSPQLRTPSKSVRCPLEFQASPLRVQSPTSPGAAVANLDATPPRDCVRFQALAERPSADSDAGRRTTLLTMERQVEGTRVWEQAHSCIAAEDWEQMSAVFRPDEIDSSRLVYRCRSTKKHSLFGGCPAKSRCKFLESEIGADGCGWCHEEGCLMMLPVRPFPQRRRRARPGPRAGVAEELPPPGTPVHSQQSCSSLNSPLSESFSPQAVQVC